MAATCIAAASRRGYAKHRLIKFKGIKKENFLSHLKEYVPLYFTAFVAFQDAATSVAKYGLDITTVKTRIREDFDVARWFLQ